MYWRRCLRLALLSLLTVGCSVNAAETENKIPDAIRAMLEKAERFELLSLDPVRPQEEPTDGFHGWIVLGKTAITEARTRERLVAALQKGVEENRVAAACFAPRHGIRLTRDGKTVDLVICFECHNVAVHIGDEQAESFHTTRSPEPTFDAVLKRAKVPLAEKSS